jgi:predicted DNA-binding protein
MSSQQSSTPYSLRLPNRLSQLIEQFAKKIGKPAPDTVRAGIEAAFSNEYRMLALEAANADRADTLRILRGTVAEANSESRLPLPVYSGLMYFLHWAYLHAGSSGHANPRYVTAMLDVIGDLIELGENMSFTDGHRYVRGCLGI